jgi:hypothetical protein
MTPLDLMMLMAGFFIVLAIGGVWADSKERRDARKRNRR